jgi:transcriptional regulator with XRE-family HTH domain
MSETAAGEPFPLEELIQKASGSARDAFIERSAAFEAGDLVRMMRETADLTQKDLAHRISTSQSHLSEVERGNGLQGPTFSMLRKVATACGVNLRIEMAPETNSVKVYNARREIRGAIAEGLGVPLDDVGQALIAARDKALVALSMTFIEQILKAKPDMAYSYAKWLGAAKHF